MIGILDTNVILYLLGGRLLAPLPSGAYGISVITEMELLCWPSLTAEETAKVQHFLASLEIFELTSGIRTRAVSLRRQWRVKLPDAIICATALEAGVPLWTCDATLPRIDGLDCQTVVLKP